MGSPHERWTQAHRNEAFNCNQIKLNEFENANSKPTLVYQLYYFD